MRTALGLVALTIALGAEAEIPWDLLPVRLGQEQRHDVARGRIARGLLPLQERSLHEGYAIAVLPIASARVLRAITDYDAYDDNYMPYVTDAVVRRREDGRLLRCERVDPPLLDARHYCVWATDPSATTHDGGVVRTIITWSYVEGSGNIVTTSGSWTVLALSDGRSVICYRVRADVGSILPAWALNLATQVALPQVVRRVHARAQTY